MSKTLASTATPVLPDATATEESRTGIPFRKVLLGVAGALLLVLAGTIGARHLRFALSHEETDDAQVEGDVSPVLPRVSGYVARILVTDNQHVTAGQALVELDANDLDLKVAGAAAAAQAAQAAVNAAQAGLVNARAAFRVAQANAEVAAVKDSKAASDLRRDTALFHSKAISDQEWTDGQAAAAVAHAQRTAADRQVEAARTQVGIMAAQVETAKAQLLARASDLSYARLQRSYAAIVAPIAGTVSRKSVEPGEFVQAGQTLLSIASDRDAWVVANFKETQLADMRVGEPAQFTVDSYPGVTFHGHVDSLAAATGARFALLPPDNATGNFVKVTQRVPVKIVLDAPPPGGRVLRQGMSVDVAVQVRN
jgi:membrane fusion protein (multidrug efflux system)